MGLPILDADGMGRAFPSLEFITPTLHGATASPMSFADEHGNEILIVSPTNKWMEDLARVVAVTSGAIGMMALCPMNGRQAKDWLVHGVLTVAQELGAAVRARHTEGDDPLAFVLEKQNGQVIHEGTVVHVERRNEGGWTKGTATVQGTGDHTESVLSVDFQNEHLIATVDGSAVATVPDLIMLLAQDSAEPIPAEDLRFGQRVVTIAMPCDAQWRTEAGLAIAGPRAFGYDIDFSPIADPHPIEHRS